MEGSLTGLPLPTILRPLSPWSDDELIAFSHRKRSYRVEKNTKGELPNREALGVIGELPGMRVNIARGPVRVSSIRSHIDF